MSETRQKPREFEPIQEPQEISQYLKEATKTFASALMWIAQQENGIQTQLALFSEVDQVLYVWVPKELNIQRFLGELLNKTPPECLFSISLTRANIFFKATYLGYDNAGFKFKIPEIIYKVQRRKNLRFPIPDGHILWVEFQDPLFPEKRMKKKVLDISAGGLSFLILEDEIEVFGVDLILNDMQFQIKGRPILCQGEIRHSKPLSEEAMRDSKKRWIKIGVYYRQMNVSDSEFIAAYVFDESRKYFSKFI